MRQLSIVEIENAMDKWLTKGIREFQIPDGTQVKCLVLTKESCLFLKKEMDETLSHISIQTEFEVPKMGRNLFDRLLDKYNGDVVLISMGLPYHLIKARFHKGMGFIDGVASEGEYHDDIKNHFKALYQYLRTQYEAFVLTAHEIHVDTSPFIDREIGYWTGLGHYGRHHQLMNAMLGASFNIGFMVVGINHEAFDTKAQTEMMQLLAHRKEQSRLFMGCKTCSKCVDACPTQICGEIEMERSKCLSYLTQTKEAIDVAYLPKLSNRLYGCSTCQYACPYSHIIEDSNIGLIELEKIIAMSQRQFKREFSHLGFAWRGLSVLKRNAYIAMRNQGITLTSEQCQGLKSNPLVSKYMNMR